jgi:hypothetical protein
MNCRGLFSFLAAALLLTLPWRPGSDHACVWREGMSIDEFARQWPDIDECAKYITSNQMENA